MNHFENKKVENMGVFLNDDVLKLAHERIRAEEPDYPIELKLGDDDSTVVVSRNKKDLLPLGQIEYNTVTYYVGVQR